MVRHKVTVILEVLRGKETPMAFLCRKIILSQVTNTVSILQLLKKHILEILPIDFPYYLSYRLDSIQVKCVTGKFTQIWDMIYVVWDQWIWGCAPSQVIERLVFLSESVFFFFWCLNFFSVHCNDLMYILHKTNIPYLGNRNIIFKSGGNMLLVDGFNARVSKKQMDHVPK